MTQLRFEAFLFFFVSFCAMNSDCIELIDDKAYSLLSFFSSNNIDENDIVFIGHDAGLSYFGSQKDRFDRFKLVKYELNDVILKNLFDFRKKIISLLESKPFAFPHSTYCFEGEKSGYFLFVKQKILRPFGETLNYEFDMKSLHLGLFRLITLYEKHNLVGSLVIDLESIGICSTDGSLSRPYLCNINFLYREGEMIYLSSKWLILAGIFSGESYEALLPHREAYCTATRANLHLQAYSLLQQINLLLNWTIDDYSHKSISPDDLIELLKFRINCEKYILKLVTHKLKGDFLKEITKLVRDFVVNTKKSIPKKKYLSRRLSPRAQSFDNSRVLLL